MIKLLNQHLRSCTIIGINILKVTPSTKLNLQERTSNIPPKSYLRPLSTLASILPREKKKARRRKRQKWRFFQRSVIRAMKMCRSCHKEGVLHICPLKPQRRCHAHMFAHGKEYGLENDASHHETRSLEWTLIPQDARPKKDAHATKCTLHNGHLCHRQNL